jgi:predicted AlkP superfamily phosphohydrolase/phosphomutase/tetratricopeptide (TPR) repeat protein
MTVDVKRKVLLIGWDAADWEHINPLIEQGLMPTLDKIINNGVMGNLATLHPVLSPMLWNSVATGKYAHKHGVHGFIEPDPLNGGARPSSSHSRKVKALWNIFTQEGLRSNVIGWWASHPAEAINGCVVTNAFNGTKFNPQSKQFEASKGTIHPEDRSPFLSQFKVSTNELTHEHVFPFIPNADKIDQEKDQRIDSFAKVLSECATIQSVGTAVMETEPWDFMAIYFSAIDHFCHGFMQYHPPRMANTPEEDFEIYKDVINGAYRFHDMMLARQLELAGPDTTVIICSDHGFQSGDLRPYTTPREPAGPAVWHRDMGMIVISGPGIKKDERIYGASLIDIAPTILALYGLPIGEDMDGRPLIEAFEEPPKIKTIPSWEDVPGDCGMHASEEQMSEEDADELMQQFAALGYIDDPDADKEKQFVDADVELKYNLARNYLWTKQVDQALTLFEEIARKRPWETRYLTHLADCYYQAGYLRQAERVLRASFADISKVPNPTVLLTWAKLQLELGESHAAVVGLVAAEKINMRLPGILIQVGDIYIKMRRLDDAQRVYEKALLLHEESPLAHQGLSGIHLRKRELPEAADHALRAVGLIHRLPIAHFRLGVAMARTGHYERAVFAFETALLFSHRMQNAHRWLAALYRSKLNDQEKADFHQEKARESSEEAKSHRVDLGDRRHTLFELP